MREVHVVWVAIGFLILTLLFPPYGYTRYTTRTTFLGTAIPPWEDHYVVPWTYVQHGFILSRPPFFDPELDQMHPSSREPRVVVNVTVNNMGIAWPIVAVQAGVICLIAGGVIYTLRRRGRAA